MTNLVKSISRSQGTYCSLTIIILFGKISDYSCALTFGCDTKAFLWLPDVPGTLDSLNKLCARSESRRVQWLL